MIINGIDIMDLTPDSKFIKSNKNSDIIFIYFKNYECLSEYFRSGELCKIIMWTILNNKQLCIVGLLPEKHTIRELLENATNITYYTNMEEFEEKVLSKNNKIWFTSDTHFGEQRTLDLSKRPFSDVSEMNEDMVSKWNSKISRSDIVYHLGDFGDFKFLKELNFKKMYFLPGNYDIYILDKINDERVVIIEPNTVILDKYILRHEPISSPRIVDTDVISNIEKYFILYGHIHGTQKVRKFGLLTDRGQFDIGGLNVGVDCHHFYPISLDDIEFYHNACLNHYDNDVFGYYI